MCIITGNVNACTCNMFLDIVAAKDGLHFTLTNPL